MVGHKLNANGEPLIYEGSSGIIEATFAECHLMNTDFSETRKIERKPSADLLHSMALRYRHDFELDGNPVFMSFGNPESKDDTLSKMKATYELVFNAGYLTTDGEQSYIPKEAELDVLIGISALLHEETVEDVTEKLESGNYSGILISAKQVYEEISGEGFYCWPKITKNG